MSYKWWIWIFIASTLRSTGEGVLFGREINREKSADKPLLRYQASLLIDLLDGKYDKQCSGGLISVRESEFLIATAAHCFFDESSQFMKSIKVTLGSVDAREISPEEKEYRVINVYFLDDWMFKRNEDSDIAILKVSAKLKENQFLALNIPPPQQPNPKDETKIEAVVSGYGDSIVTNVKWDYENKRRIIKTESDGKLRELVVQVSDWKDEPCKNEERQNAFICATPLTGLGLCRGDSGAPLVERKANLLLGIYTTGPPDCNHSQWVTRYIRVATPKINKFIDDVKEGRPSDNIIAVNLNIKKD